LAIIRTAVSQQNLSQQIDAQTKKFGESLRLHHASLRSIYSPPSVVIDRDHLAKRHECMGLSEANDKQNTADLNFTKNFIFIGKLQYDRGGKLRSLLLCIPLNRESRRRKLFPAAHLALILYAICEKGGEKTL